MSFIQLKPSLTPDEAVALATRLHPRQPIRATQLDGERDQTFRMEEANGDLWVLKVANPEESEERLELQVAVLDHLESEGVDGVPRVIRTRSGAARESTELSVGRCTIRALSWVPGRRLVDVRPHGPELLQEVGALVGRLARALDGFRHPADSHRFAWDLVHGPTEIAERLGDVEDETQRARLQRWLDRLAGGALAALPDLPQAMIQGDANDWNVMVHVAPATPVAVSGLIDFGDLMRTARVCEPAIASAYALLGKHDPMAAVASVARGFHAECPLSEPEIDVLFELAAARLCLSVAMSARQKKERPDDPYLTVSEAPAWEALERLEALSPRLLRAAVRDACGLSPCPQNPSVTAWIGSHQESSPVIEGLHATAHVLDLSISSPGFGGGDSDTGTTTRRIFRELEDAGASIGIGRYDEVRRLYPGDLYAADTDGFPERRTIHLGIDLFAVPGTEVCAPLDGEVVGVRDNAGRFDYGPTVILRHAPENGPAFHTLYGHLSRESIARISPGQTISRGDPFAAIGPFPENGDWPPHVHIQVITDLLDREAEFPGVCTPSQRRLWESFSPDPSPLLGFGAEARAPRTTPERVLADRETVLSQNISLSYARPLHIVRGEGAFLLDAGGQAYLDGVNNVCQVGHSHPRVVAALHRQAAVLNTNTRYLHEGLAAYAHRLAGLFPDPLSVVFLCCSGSEANELALRLARTYTGREDILCIDGAYHGNTGALVDLSPYKHAGPGGNGPPDHVHVLPLPDPYRGDFRTGDGDLGALYADTVRATLDQLAASERAPAGFLCESFPGCGGQIEPPEGYFARAFASVRAAGGLCIADEVQVGFGRVGAAWWGFELHDVVPDIVTVGKPIGNGHPMAAVVTTPDIASAFSNGMEWFNTFGGNPVSCAVGMAVLDVIEDEGLLENARRVGTRLKDGLRTLQDQHPLIGDVRGCGLFLGAELVTDRDRREPATSEASYLVNRLRELGVLLSTDGTDANVIKFKPPLVWTEREADRTLELLDRVLAEDPLARSV